MVNNIDPKIWGRPTWDALYYIAFAYSDNPSQIEKTSMHSFMNLVGKVLPCEKCRFNYTNHIQMHPLTDLQLASRYNLVNWLLSINNEVNYSQGKPKLTYDDIVTKYFSEKEVSFIIKQSHLTVLLIIVAIIILIIYMKLKHQ
jgi:hypothetical protein